MIYSYIFTALCFFSSLASAELYKCQTQDGRLGFSDRPCPTGSKEETVIVKKDSIKQDSWINRLKTQKSPLIDIIDIVSKGDETTIKYRFKKTSYSTDFLKLTGKLSSMSVTLMKIKKPKSEAMWRAEIIVSNKRNPLFDKLKKKTNIKHATTNQSSNATL